MECNKDEALRARQIAKARMQRGEFVEALKFATKAKKLYADVENITQILTICEVHNAALSTSDMDWYAILQIERFADEAAIKKQYMRLALLLHPDKNKFAGAEAAFKLIGQANEVLSDQTKRSLYDIKFGASANGNVSANATNNHKSSDSHHYSNRNMFAAKYYANRNVFAANYQKNSYPNSTGSNNQAGQRTFWTSCQHCKSLYQYSILVVNATLCCQQCKKPFNAYVDSYFGFPQSLFTLSRARDTDAANSYPNTTSSNNQATFWTSCQHCNTKYVYCIPFVKAILFCHKCFKSFKARGIALENNIQKESPKPASESTGGEHAVMQSNPISMKRYAADFEGEEGKDGFVLASRYIKSETSTNVGSKRVRQSAPDSGEILKVTNGEEMNDANVRENHVDPS